MTTAPNPGLKVDGIGAIGLPLSDRDAKDLISRCRQSPFGKGGETIVDTGVRNSFELNPSEFTLSNPVWSTCINALVGIAYKELGLTCGRQHVVAELYKLLLYHEGAFFRPHQDSEKTPGMLGTLVVCLPSDHQGGSVILKHQKDEYRFDSSKSSTFGTAFAAWYSDVFHEVQKVTSGYRLVLTYNLVQTGSSIPQKAPDSDSNKRLLQSLQVYNQGILANLANFPNYLAYSLEHTYSQAGLKLSSLKGKDFARVQNMVSACAKLGFETYLALKEKCIHKDEDYGDDEFSREEGFNYVLDMEGRVQETIPDYDSNNVLDDGNATDDEEPDEEEHEGYTGNEGTPSHYWYRTSMLLVVPPSRKIDFRFDTDAMDFKAALKFLREHRFLKPTPESHEAQQMSRLCQLVIKKSAPKTYRYDTYAESRMHETSEDECMAEVAIICLEMNWYDIYQALHSKWKLRKSVLQTLGSYLGSSEYDAGLWKVQELLQSESSLPERLEALEHLHNGIERSRSPESGRSQAHDFCQDMLKHTLRLSGPLRKYTGENIAGVIVAYEPELDGLVWTALKRCTTPTVAGLLLRVNASNPAGNTEAFKDFIWRILDLLWTSTFTLEGPEIQKAVPGSWGQMRLVPEQDILTHVELVTLLDINQKYGSTPTVDVLPILCEAVAQTSATYSRDHVFPFIASLVRRQVPALSPHDTRMVSDNVINLIRDGLTAIVTNYINPEPQRATNFALPRVIPEPYSNPPRGCSVSCDDCSQINAFLASQQIQYNFQAPQKRREHVDLVFMPNAKGMYDAVTIATRGAHTWQMNKTFDKHYAKEHRAWTLRVKWLESELRKLSRAQDGLFTEETLGRDAYRGIRGCTIEGLNSVAAGRRALRATSGNARKRKAEGLEDGSGKKARTEEESGGVEIIDLT